jgi:uncharacterized protein (TIGR03437 family)
VAARTHQEWVGREHSAPQPKITEDAEEKKQRLSTSDGGSLVLESLAFPAGRTSHGKVVATGVMKIAAVAPGLFSANASGRGVAAATALRVKADGTQQYEPVARYDEAQKKFVAVPLDLGPESEQVFVILFGTGFRYRSSLAATTSRIGGTNAEVLYAGPPGGFVGLDQANVRLPRSLKGRGEVDAVLAVEGKTANTVKVAIR